MRRTSLIAVVALGLACTAEDSAAPADTEETTDDTDDDDDDDDGGATSEPGDGSTGEADASSDDGTGDTGDTETGEPDGPRPSPGCGTEPGDILDGVIDVGGEQRTYVLELPEGYDPNILYPLQWGFHASYGSGAAAQMNYGLGQWWDGQAIGIYPDSGETSPGVTAWITQSGGRDYEFILALYEALGNQLCFDLDRVFSFGYSSGGYMANAMACYRSDLFRGAGPISAGLSGACLGPVAIFAAHGETDTTVPFSSGTSARDQWVALNGCSEDTTPTTMEGCVQYEGCDDGYPVIWCTHPGGHTFFPMYAADAVNLFKELD